MPATDNDLRQAKAELDPKLAEYIGPLEDVSDDDGKRYIIKNIESHATMLDVAKIMWEAMRWKVRPERFLKTQSKNRNSIVVFADQEPKHTSVPYEHSGEWVQIVDYVDPKVVYNPWKKLFDKHPDCDQDGYDDAPFEYADLEELDEVGYEMLTDTEEADGPCGGDPNKIDDNNDDEDAALPAGFYHGRPDENTISTPKMSRKRLMMHGGRKIPQLAAKEKEKRPQRIVKVRKV